MSGRAVQKSAGQGLIRDGVPGEAILGTACTAVIIHKYPQAARD